MVFSSPLFLFIYLPVVLLLYYISPLRWRNMVLFAVSLVFYGWGEPVYLFLMAFSILINYIAGYLVERLRADTRKAKAVLAVNVVLNLSLLVFFKYFNFIVSNLSLIPGISIPTLDNVTLPIGISFYTFQAMSYPIDVYRQQGSMQKNFVSFGAFVTLFPQLIAGPIIRYKDVDDQLRVRTHSMEKFSSGAVRFTVGLCKKVLLANNIGALWDAVIATPSSELSVLYALLGVAAFSFQIYFDFSGYSDMAVGLGRMLGFEFLENFNYPYIAKSITDFWRRWHISLSTWFRDYVYIPLGGNRVSPVRRYVNILIVWLLTGIWHGANWNFIIWGLYFALLLILEKWFMLDVLKKLPAFFGHLYTLLLVAFSWAIFAIEDFSVLHSFLRALFGFGGTPLANGVFWYTLRSHAVLLVLLTVASTPVAATLFRRLPEKVRHIAAPVLMLAGLLLSTAYLVDSTYNPFLYFRF